MGRTLKLVLRIVLGVIAVFIVIAAFFLASLVHVGGPAGGRSLRFDGFVLLPNKSALNVADYLTIDGRSLFVTSISSGDVYRIDLSRIDAPAGAQVATFSGDPRAHGVAIDPVSHLAFVTRSEVNRVDVFDPVSMKPVKRIPVSDDPDGIFYDPHDKLIYATEGDAMSVALIDPATRTKAGEIPLGARPEFAVPDPETGAVYQNLASTNMIAAVDVEGRAVTGRWPLTGCEEPTGLAIDSAHRLLFAGCGRNSKVAVFDLATHRVTQLLDAPGNPDSVAFDPVLKRIYATGARGILSVIRQDAPDRYEVLDAISLHLGAHTLAVDPATHKVFAAYASLFVPPRVAVFTPIGN